MIKFGHKQSLYATLGIIIFLIISLITLINSTYIYNQIKDRLIEDMKQYSGQSIVTLKVKVANLVASYSENEYINLITHEMEQNSYFSIIVEDNNMGKILGEQTFLNGKIRDVYGNIIDFDPENSEHIRKQEMCFYLQKKDLVSLSGKNLGAISICVSDKAIKKELDEVIFFTIVNSLVISLFLILALFISIRKFILNPVSNITNVINLTDKDGIPTKLISEKGSLEITILANTINNMINSIKDSREELIKQHGLLKERENSLNKSMQEQAQLTIKVKASETHLRTLVHSLPDLIWLKDAEGVYLSCNPKFERFFGSNEAEIIGKTDYDFVDKELADLFRKHDKQAMVAGGPTTNEEEVTYADDGHKELLETVKTPMYASDGALVGVLGVGRDITKRREIEEQLRRTQKMDALGKLTGGIAHDFNNMLGVVLGYADLLKGVSFEKAEAHEYIQEIIHAGERGAKLTNKLLSFYKSTSVDTAKWNVNELLEEQRRMLETTLTARITVKLKLENKIWPVYLDKSDFEDAILNMSINASHAIDDTGSFTIETNNKSINALQAKQLGVDVGDYVLVQIKDSGCGMDKSTKEKIFDPFFSTKGNKGTGLGLSQVYGFISGCGGAITVKSTPGHGTEFTLYFPRYEGDDTRGHDINANGSVDLKGKESILVVDDEPALLNLTRKILKQNGYEVHSAESAEEALIILETRHIDVLVSDVIMPNMDGYAFASIVQEKYPNIKIQLASGFSTGENITKGNEVLSQNLLQKPYSSQKLLERIRALLIS